MRGKACHASTAASNHGDWLTAMASPSDDGWESPIMQASAITAWTTTSIPGLVLFCNGQMNNYKVAANKVLLGDEEDDGSSFSTFVSSFTGAQQQREESWWRMCSSPCTHRAWQVGSDICHVSETQGKMESILPRGVNCFNSPNGYTVGGGLSCTVMKNWRGSRFLVLRIRDITNSMKKFRDTGRLIPWPGLYSDSPGLGRP
ncbi:hypothetical protein DAI22_11g164901 [Oryza sativa Japonica Group]|nr:hypothetical protein DAI22_11g164901 [Oryza sativa Japonica Group]